MPSPEASRALDENERRTLAKYLEPNVNVIIDDRIRGLSREILKGESNPVRGAKLSPSPRRRAGAGSLLTPRCNDPGLSTRGRSRELVPYFRRMKIDQFVLELATPRAGSVKGLRDLPDGRLLEYGAVNPRTIDVELPQNIAARVQDAARVLGDERLHLNPDCGFGTFSERPVATEDVAYRKLCALAEAARILKVTRRNVRGSP